MLKVICKLWRVSEKFKNTVIWGRWDKPEFDNSEFLGWLLCRKRFELFALYSAKVAGVFQHREQPIAVAFVKK